MPLKKLGELVIPSRLDQLAEVDAFTEKLIKASQLPPSILDDVAISVSEAVNNAIQHGNKLNANKKVTIRYYCSANFLRLIVQDQGAGFLLETIPDPRQEQNLLKSSGRGLLIMRHLMDRVDARGNKTGMRIIMDKYYPKGSHVQ